MNRQKIRTDYETMFRFIQQNRLDPDDYKDMLDRAREYKFYERRFLPKPPTLVSNLLHDLRVVVKEMEALRDYPYRNFTKLCPSCEYYPLCVAEMMDLDQEFLLSHEYITRKKEEPDGEEGEISLD